MIKRTTIPNDLERPARCTIPDRLTIVTIYLTENKRVGLNTEKDRKGPKRTEKDRKGPKRTEKDRKGTEKDRKETEKDRKGRTSLLFTEKEAKIRQ